MSRLIPIFILVICATAASGASLPIVKVTLRADSTVQPAHVVCVRDIAQVVGPAEQARKVGDVMIGVGPLPGKHRSVTSSQVMTRIGAVEIKAYIKMTGSKSCDLTGSCVRWDSEAISTAAREMVESSLPQDGSSYETRVDRASREMVTAGGSESKLQARLLSKSARPGANTVAVDAMLDGRAVATTSVTVQVTRRAEVLTALTSLTQGQALTEQNTAWVLQDITRTPNAVVRSQDGADPSWVAKRSLAAGTVLTSVDVTSPPTVKRGDTVILIVKCGTVRLATTAEVKQDRHQGEMVAVRPAASEENVTGRVVEPGLVEVVR